MLSLSIMSDSDYNDYLAIAIPDYASDKIKAGTWTKKEALHRAELSYNTYLPEGNHTPDHYLYTIQTSGTVIGYTWIKYEASPVPSAFIYDIMLFDTFQNQGYGTTSMALIEEQAKALGAHTMGLHVFGHNKRALHVYQKCGYEITDYSMTKPLH